MAKQDLKLDGVKVVLGVSGGIAAFKAIDLASKMTAAGAEVRTVLTESAIKLVSAKSFEAVTNGPAHTSMWEQQEFKIGVNLAGWADLIIIAPAGEHHR
jgi:phosphopantothenoylcysteine decarboxylase/phosphopantothenate--cysteine ligase